MSVLVFKIYLVKDTIIAILTHRKGRLQLRASYFLGVPQKALKRTFWDIMDYFFFKSFMNMGAPVMSLA